MIERVAYLSMHTSPLLLPGRGDAGGMNVYIDELAATMAGRGVAVDVFTRRTDPSVPEVVEATAGYRVIHIDAGSAEPMPTADQPGLVGEFAAGVLAWAGTAGMSYDLVHSHYWLSGWAGILVKRGSASLWPTLSTPSVGSRMPPGGPTSRPRGCSASPPSTRSSHCPIV